MQNIVITETRIGATTYTVERVFSKDAKENALQVIKRLLLQKARSEGQGVSYENCQHDLLQNQRKHQLCEQKT